MPVPKGMKFSIRLPGGATHEFEHIEALGVQWESRGPFDCIRCGVEASAGIQTYSSPYFWCGNCWEASGQRPVIRCAVCHTPLKQRPDVFDCDACGRQVWAR